MRLVVVSKKANDIIRFMGAPRFESAGNTTQAGPTFIGTLMGQWKVYYNPYLPEDAFLMGYKGQALVDAGLIYAPYIPFYSTETVTLDDFLGRKGFATSYGKKMVNSNMYVKGTITGVPTI